MIILTSKRSWFIFEDKTYLNPHSFIRYVENSMVDLIVTLNPSAVFFVKYSSYGINLFLTLVFHKFIQVYDSFKTYDLWIIE